MPPRVCEWDHDRNTCPALTHPIPHESTSQIKMPVLKQAGASAPALRTEGQGWKSMTLAETPCCSRVTESVSFEITDYVQMKRKPIENAWKRFYITCVLLWTRDQLGVGKTRPLIQCYMQVCLFVCLCVCRVLIINYYGYWGVYSDLFGLVAQADHYFTAVQVHKMNNPWTPGATGGPQLSRRGQYVTICPRPPYCWYTSHFGHVQSRWLRLVCMSVSRRTDHTKLDWRQHTS